MRHTPSKDDLLDQLKKIQTSHLFSRSTNLTKLLSYLIDKEILKIDQGSEVSSNPKEIEIAIEVFGKSAEFNVAEDASVRVYMSRLRKKLEEYYLSAGIDEPFIISIPVGEYSLAFTKNSKCINTVDFKADNTPPQNPKNSSQHGLIKRVSLFNLNQYSKQQTALLIGCSLTIIVHLLLLIDWPSISNTAKVEQAKIMNDPIWQTVQTQHNNMIVLGTPIQNHLQDNLQIDMRNDMQNKSGTPVVNGMTSNTDTLSAYSTTKSFIVALKNILSVSANFRYTPIIFAADLTAEDIKHNNIIYIGYFSEMGILKNYFNGSPLKLERNQMALRAEHNNQHYQAPVQTDKRYTDYALFAKIDGPRQNKVYLISGFTDSALLWLSWFTTTSQQLAVAEFGQYIGGYPLTDSENFELFFKIPSMQGTDIGFELISNSVINNQAVWTILE